MNSNRLVAQPAHLGHLSPPACQRIHARLNPWQASPEKRPGLGQDVSDLKRSAAKALSESPRFGAGATRNSGFLFGLNMSFDGTMMLSSASLTGGASVGKIALGAQTCPVFFCHRVASAASACGAGRMSDATEDQVR
jgi:hypothetical protein